MKTLSYTQFQFEDCQACWLIFAYFAGKHFDTYVNNQVKAIIDLRQQTQKSDAI